MRALSRLGVAPAVLAVLAALLGCDVKVPITDVNAAFVVADASWFAAEQTLFVFYRVDAEQGLGPESQIELAFRTDDDRQDFAPLQSFTPVHPHLPVDCGSKSRCGSMSLRVPLPPRDVRLRLRYHRDGQQTLAAPLVFNTIDAGPAHSHRSLVVYGVFDETNTRVQWRARHQFPTLRNPEVQALGLRRHFVIRDAVFGDVDADVDVDGVDDDGSNPYSYGFASRCPADLTLLDWAAAETSERAIFGAETLPLTASTAAVVCAQATVQDANGDFETTALAQKNPQTAPAFPLLRTPVTTNTVLRWLLKICGRTISEPHEAMQVQRLSLQGEEEVCVDDFAQAGFADGLASRFRDRIDEVRVDGDDMVLAFALHHDDSSGRLAAAVEDALEQIMPAESSKSSPRVSGAFVFDSRAHALVHPDLERSVLWCPGSAGNLSDDLDQISSAAERSCPLLPDAPDITLGPLKFNSLPILPTRAQYLTFIDKFSEDQAGRVLSTRFLAPTRTPLSQDIAVGDFGKATFFNDEILTAGPTDSFSYCAPLNDVAPVVFRLGPSNELFPLAFLPEVHRQAPQDAYGLGLLWDFPFLMRMKFETALAGSVNAIFITVPFGVKDETEAFLGTPLWLAEEFSLRDELLRCSRFCDHPTFDSAGVYNVRQVFNEDYLAACYRPLFPQPGDGGFPDDP